MTITDGSTLYVLSDGTARNTTVEEGGALKAVKQAQIANMVANGGAILEIEAGTVLSGNIVIDKLADVSLSSYDFSELFDAMNKDAESLTLTGGGQRCLYRKNYKRRR